MTAAHTVTDNARAVFLTELEQGASLTKAAQVAGFDRRSFQRLRFDPDGGLTEFGQQVAEAVEAGTDTLIDEAKRRAADGYEKPVYQGGVLVGHVREYSDQLLIFLIKKRDPSYRENHQVQLTGPDGGPVRVEHERRLTLADVIELSGSLNGPGGSARPELPAASAVLAEPEPGERPAGAVPA
jgi:hypothetical protein